MDAASFVTFDRTRRGLIAAITLLGALLLLSPVRAQSKPSVTADSIRPLVLELNDRDAAVRDRATQALMDLEPDDLPLLHDVVAGCAPLSPNQVVLLHDVVSQIYLSRVDYPTENLPFLGISYPRIEGYSPTNDPSVRVVTRYVGFSSFKMLREGDIIVGIADLPPIQLNTDNLSNIIGSRKPGTTINLLVIRHGRQITVACELRAKPLGSTVEALDSWSASRQLQADQYWREHFGPLLEPGAS